MKIEWESLKFFNSSNNLVHLSIRVITIIILVSGSVIICLFIFFFYGGMRGFIITAFLFCFLWYFLVSEVKQLDIRTSSTVVGRNKEYICFSLQG